MHRIKPLFAIALTLALQTSWAQEQHGHLVINELMQSNIDGIMDDLREFPDSWVEVYNPDSVAVNLKDYKIGITSRPQQAYQLPDKVVEAKQHVVIYCDKEGQKLHTNFRLESGKNGEVYLFKDGQVVDQVSGLKKQPAPGIAYGRKDDGGEEWGYQLTPTPEAVNCGRVCGHDHILGQPVFSRAGQVFTSQQQVQLTLTVPEDSPEGTIICYTTDGTEPDTTSTRYVAPIDINDNKVIRARLFCDGWLSPRSTTHSYLFFTRRLTLPVVSIVTNSRYLDGSYMGIFANNSSENRKNWRRPINIEYFTEGNTPSRLNQLCETRVAGGATRSAAKKSMAIYAHKRFGTKRFEHEFFPDQRPGMTDYKSLVLRNAGNDFDYLYMRDAIVQRTMAEHADLDWQAWQPAIVYINGNYHGILNIRERGNEDNVYTNHDGLEDIDLIENWSDLKEGSWENYNQFKAFYSQDGHTMEEYEQWMDCQEFINLMAMNLYFNNLDFPGNNIIMWRPRAEGGRWRWIAKDADFTLGLYDEKVGYKILEWLYTPHYDYAHNWGANSEKSTLLFRQLMEDSDFRREFIDRCAIYMGDFMNEKGIRAIWDPMYEKIRYEYPNHRKLINQWWPVYNDELSHARNWLSKRTNEFYTQLGNFYHLGNAIPLIINKDGEATQNIRLSFNGVRLSNEVFNGRFYADRVISLEGGAGEGQMISGWHIKKVAGSSVTEEFVAGEKLSMVMPACNSLTITAAIVPGQTGISTLRSDATYPQGIYDLSGRKVRIGTTSLDGLPKGVYIVNGRKVVKTR